jgi:Holliday junction resolvase RusA-like endonuclease
MVKANSIEELKSATQGSDCEVDVEGEKEHRQVESSSSAQKVEPDIEQGEDGAESVLLVLRGIPISKNTHDSKHWAQQQKVHDKWQDRTFAELEQADIPYGFNGPVSVHFTFYPSDKRTRDVENFVVHGIIDGLVTYGLIEDDSYKYLPEVSKLMESTFPEQSKTVVEVTQIDG